MNVLQLGKFYPIRGGVEKVMWMLTRGLSERGVRCDMLCASTDLAEVDAADRPLLQEDGSFRFNDCGRVIRVKALAKKAATMISPAMVRWLRRHSKEYDIIHIHHPDPMAALALRLSGYRGRVVLHWHSDILSQRALLLLYRPLQRWLIRRADRIVGTTPAYLEASLWLQGSGVQAKCTAIPIGIRALEPDVTGVVRIRSRFPGRTLLFSLGRLVPYKGFGYLIESMMYLPERFHLVIGGDGPMRQDLISQIEQGGLQGRVTLEGRLPDADVPSWFGACDIFVLPSVMKTEAFGIVQIEAMSCGKPVVATTIPGSGVSWVNQAGVSGENAAPCDAQALAAAIQKVDVGCESYAEGARRRFDSLFTDERMIQTIINLYETLL